jgi:hypothetical protein
VSAVGDLTWELCDLEQTVLGGGPIETHSEGAQVALGREVARTASLTLDLDDPFAQLASVGDQVLRCSADGWTDPAFVGRVLQHDITYNGDSAQLTMSAADPLAHLEACLVFWTAAMTPAAETFKTYYANTDPSTMMSDLISHCAANGHGIVDGTLALGAADQKLGFPAGSTVADGLRAIAGLSSNPEFEIAPIFDATGKLAELNTYYPKQGTDKTATIILRLGESDDDDELLGFEIAPSMSGLVNRHVVVGDAPDGAIASSSVSGVPKNYPKHPAYRASHAASIAQYGVWETAESVSGASNAFVLIGVAQANIAANVDPVTAIKVTLDPDNAPAFGPQGAFWLGDIITIEVTTPAGNPLSYEARVATAGLTEAENGDVLVDLIVEPVDDLAGVSGASFSVVVDSTEGTDPPPPPEPEPDPCAPVADTGGVSCPDAGDAGASGTSAAAPKKKKKKKKKK